MKRAEKSRLLTKKLASAIFSELKFCDEVLVAHGFRQKSALWNLKRTKGSELFYLVQSFVSLVAFLLIFLLLLVSQTLCALLINFSFKSGLGI